MMLILAKTPHGIIATCQDCGSTTIHEYDPQGRIRPGRILHCAICGASAIVTGHISTAMRATPPARPNDPIAGANILVGGLSSDLHMPTPSPTAITPGTPRIREDGLVIDFAKAKARLLERRRPGASTTPPGETAA